MRIIRISKGNGKFRTIYAPSKAEKWELKQLLPELNRLMKKCEFAHGFIQGRSPVTNALLHVGFNFSLCFDLKDFFDTITPSHVKGKLPQHILEKVFVDGHPRQGLPTSPAVANLAAYDLDIRINRLKKKFNINFVYSRYADDLSFSFNDVAVKDILLKEVPSLVEAFHFIINDKKTCFQDSKSGRRHITGIGVDYNNIYPTRAAKRRLRAAQHQQNLPQAQGLAEWCNLKSPRPRKARNLHLSEINKAAFCIYTTLQLNKGQSDVYHIPQIKGNVRRVRKAVQMLKRKVNQRNKLKADLNKPKA